MRVVVLGLIALTLFLISGCNSAESRMATGDIFYQRGNYENALEQYRSAQQKDPTLIGVDEKIRQAEVRLFLKRGEEAAQRGEWEVAERAYGQVRRLDPNNLEVIDREKQMAVKKANEHFRKGQELLGRGNPFDAIGQFEEALTLQPDHPRAAESLDRALEEKRNREMDAETAFQNGMRAQSAGNLEEAIQSFTSSLNHNPHHPRAEYEIKDAKKRFAETLVFTGDAAAGRKQWQQAAEVYRQAQNYNPRLPGLRQRLVRAQREARAETLVNEGNQAFERGDWLSAYSRFSQARELTSDQASFRARHESSREKLAGETYSTAQQAERSGDLADALSTYKTILQFYPGFRDVQERCDRIDVTIRTAERSYGAGRLSQEELDLVVAREKYRICADVFPGYKDVAKRTEIVREALAEAENLYQRAVEAESRSDDDRARILYEECLTIASPFRKSAERLARVRDRLIEKSGTHEQYEEACRAQSVKNFESARKLFRACDRREAGYKDVALRLKDVDEAIRKTQGIYKRAEQAEAEFNLTRALTLYEECLKVSDPYSDVHTRIKRIRFTLQRMEEAKRLEIERRLIDARDRYDLVLEKYNNHADARRRAKRVRSILSQVNGAYEAMLEAERREKFSQAFTYAKKIQKLCVGFKDVDTRVIRLESEVDYAKGCELEEAEKYDEAIRFFDRCARRTPDFRDVQDHLRVCRERRR